MERKLGETSIMEDKKIIELIQGKLDELSGDKAGGSGHMGGISYGNPEIIEKNASEIKFKCEVWVESEFMVAEEEGKEDEFNPYHYWKEGVIEVKNGSVLSFNLE